MVFALKIKHCPKCKAPLPRWSIPKNLKQAIRNSVICKCGREVKKNGEKVYGTNKKN